jgi:DNA-binding protein YbaB
MSSKIEGATHGGTTVLDQLSAIRGSGEASNGRVKVELDGTSNLVDLVIEPKAMRLSSDALVAAVRSAFEAAREDVQGQLTKLTPAYAVTPQETRATLDELQFEAERRLDGLTQIAADLSTQLDRLT